MSAPVLVVVISWNSIALQSTGVGLDMAEVEFSVLSCQCLNRRIPDVEMFQREIATWEKERNEKQATDARLKLKRLYPS